MVAGVCGRARAGLPGKFERKGGINQRASDAASFDSDSVVDFPKTARGEQDVGAADAEADDSMSCGATRLGAGVFIRPFF